MDSPRTTARFESLLKWVNTFEGVHSTTFHGLASGQTLLQCLHNIMPDVVVTTTENPWEELFSIFEEFCGCSLEKAVSAEEIASGNQEHIARVVVLLLAVAVQSKANEKIIADITSLDYEAQRDLMFFIESTLAKVKSHAIMAGTFTSGVGERLPSLDTPDSAQVTPLSRGALDQCTESVTTRAACHDADNHPRDGFAFPTPRRPSRPLCPANFYNGLDSRAGAKLLMSPAITSHKARSKLSNDTSHVMAIDFGDCDREEITRMKHSVRVLEGTLQVEKKLAQEYYTELCSRIEEHESLRKDYCQLERKLECLQDVKDMQDELDHATSSLAAAQKSISAYKSKIESLEVYKERALALESQVAVLESKVALSEEDRVRLERLEELLAEKSSALKHVELQLSKSNIELETKSVHVESLLQESGESQGKFNNLRRKYLQLEDTIKDLKEKLAASDDSAVKAMEEKRELVLEVQHLQGALETSHKEVLDLTSQKIECERSITALECQKAELHAELSSKISDVTSKNYEIHSLQGSIEELDVQVVRLHSDLKALEQSSAGKVSRLEQELAGKTTVLASTVSECSTLRDANKALEDQLVQLQSNVGALKQEKEVSAAAFEAQKNELSDELSSKTSELASKILEIQSLASGSKALELQVSRLQSSAETLKQAAASTEDKLQQEIAEKVEALASKEQEMGLLQAQNKELESKVSQLLSTVAELNEKREATLSSFKYHKEKLQTELSSKSSELKSKIAEVQALQSTIEALEVKMAHLESKKKSLEETAASKEEKLQQELADKILDITSKECQVKSLEVTNTDLQRQLSHLRSTVERLSSEGVAKEGELVSKQEQLQSLDAEVRELRSKVSQLESDTKALEEEKEAGLSSKDCQIQSLEAIRAELEAKMKEHCHQLKSQEQEIDTMATKITSRDLQLESLENVNKELDAQLAQVQGSYRALEKSVAAKEAESEGLRKELMLKAAEQQKLVAMLQVKLTSRETEILSLKSAKEGSERKVSELQSGLTLLKEHVSAKVADSDKRVSSLIGTRDKMSMDIELLREELAATKSSYLTLESEASMKESLLAASKEECSTLKFELLDLKQLVGDQQSLLQTATDRAASLSAQREALQRECAELKGKLEDKDESLEAVMLELKSMMDSSQQQVDALKRQVVAQNGEQSQKVKDLVSEKHSLQCEQNQLLKQVMMLKKEEAEVINSYEQSEAALAAERAISHRLRERISALESQQAAARQQELVECDLESPSSTPHFVPLTLVSQAGGDPSPTGPSPSLQLKDNIKAKVETAAPSDGDDKARVKELRRRNRRALPHLKSSYPIEMQVKEVTPINSDERLKHGSKATRTTHLFSEQVHSTTPPTPMVEDATSREGCGPRRLSAPPTSPSDYRRKPMATQQQQHQMLKLRNFLEEKATAVPKATTFDVNFSPPKAGRPKRLQENKLRRPVKENSKDPDSIRRETVLKKPVQAGNTSRSSQNTGPKTRTLRPRTNK